MNWTFSSRGRLSATKPTEGKEGTARVNPAFGSRPAKIASQEVRVQPNHLGSILLMCLGLVCLTGCRDGTKSEKEYRISVASARVFPKKADGTSWDGDDSGPDVYYQIYWRDNMVFESSVETDTLLAQWENAEINLKEVARSEVLRPRENGARVRIGEDDIVEIRLFDDDLIADDQIGSLPLAGSEIRTGRKMFRPVSGSADGLTVVIAPADAE